MTLTFKPDFAEARRAWTAYWAGDCLKRPLVYASVPKPGREQDYQQAQQEYAATRYWNGVHRQFDKNLALIEQRFDASLWLAEAIPYASASIGPDQYAAFFGPDLKFSESSKITNWVEPIITDWTTARPLKIDESSNVWRTVLDYNRAMATHARGRYLVSICDLHSHADTLSALRGPQNLCLDFYDCPDRVEQALREIRQTYPFVYETLYQAGGMSRETGTIGTAPFWCEGKFATIQCDFICLVSPEIFRRHILPAIEEEAAYLDHCVFHLDGPGALVHLDDLLAIKDLDVIQWQAGAGQPPMHTWLDVLKKCQAAGKGLHIYGPGNGLNLERLKVLHRELKPAGVLYCLDVKTEAEAREAIRWLEKNT